MQDTDYLRRVDIAGVVSGIDALGRIGVGEHGLLREVYSEPWRAAMQFVEQAMAGIGLTTRYDAAGNLYGRLDGREDGPAVVTGSHIDTVSNAGKYDGVVGVLGAIEAIRILCERRGTPARPLEILVTCDEDGARFSTEYWGSQAVAGTISPADMETIVDVDGISIGEAMRSAGFDPARIAEAARDDIHCWIELHIEQGRVLEDAGLEIGVVTALAGRWSGNARVTGREDHAGTTPMDMRRDALAGAMAMALDAIARAEALGRPTVCTVGQVAVRPGATNVVAGEVLFSFDVRDTDDERLRAFAEDWQVFVGARATEGGLTATIENAVLRPATPMAPELIAAAEAAAAMVGVPAMIMPSMASHDARILGARWPAAMIFVPSRDGRSHCPEEYTSEEPIRTGIAVLTATLEQLAYEDS